jgi:hypothetical protein
LLAGASRLPESARNLSRNVSDDYGNRFLVELIQNAHDARPGAQRDGEVAVVLAPEEMTRAILGEEGDNQIGEAAFRCRERGLAPS